MSWFSFVPRNWWLTAYGQLDKIENPGLSKGELQRARERERERRRRKKAKMKAREKNEVREDADDG